MRMISKRSGVLALVGALGLVLGACSDDTPDNPDARRVDATTVDGEIPDGPAPLNVSGTIAVVDMAITNPGLNFSGASVSINYQDLDQPFTPPTIFTGNGPPLDPGECFITVYNSGDPTGTYIDQGTVSISGTLTPVGDCNFDAQTGSYLCLGPSAGLDPGTNIINQGDGTAALLDSQGGFAGTDLVGSYMMLSGFDNAANNGSFPVVGQLGDTTVVLFNPAAVNETTAAAGPAYAVAYGRGPTPANADFVGDDTMAVTIQKNDADVPQFTATVSPSGEGLVLTTDSAEPHNMPLDANNPVTFSCANLGAGVCGPAGELVSGFVISGSTTDADLAQAGPLDMPPPVNQWASFQCLGSVNSDTVEIPTEIWQALLDTNPTRIETRVMRISAELSVPPTSIITGHGYVGWTTTN